MLYLNVLREFDIVSELIDQLHRLGGHLPPNGGYPAHC